VPRVARGAAAMLRIGMQERWIRVSLAAQQLELREGDTCQRIYPVSTGLNGAGERIGSEQTPRGAHEVAALIGDAAPCGAVFVGRQFTGEICTPALRADQPARDWILTRIVWLAGLEDGRNRGGDVDTFSRYIYIHGTPDDEPMGVPHSHGCIRMRNADILRLARVMPVGTPVTIR
jgi:L,D-transpeptidase YbiS